MNQQPNQQQHDRTDDQYGQQPSEMGTGTRTGTGMSQQPQFGGSTGQTGTGGQQSSMQDQQPSMQGSTQSSTRGTQSSTGGMRGGAGRGRGMQGGTQAGGMQGGTQHGTQSMQSHSFDDHMTDELWIALEDFSELSHVAAWCATQCATGGPELGACARVCQDIAEIAALNEMLITRDSMFGPEVADMFMQVAQEGLRTLRQYQQQHPHVLETAATIERTMNSCEALLQQVGGSRTGGRRRGTGAQMGAQRSSEQGQYGQGTRGSSTRPTEGSGQRY